MGRKSAKNGQKASFGAENLPFGAEDLPFGIFTLVIMDISRKLAIEFPDGTIRQFATITEAAQCIGVSVAAVSKAIVNGKDSVKGCKIRGLNNRMFVVRHRPEDPFVICRLTPFGVLKLLGSSEQNEKTAKMYVKKEITDDMRRIVEAKKELKNLRKKMLMNYNYIGKYLQDKQYE